MANLTPRTRSEKFLNGEDLEPITRREHFYAGRENELPEGHQEPETREEWFIQKYREAGDVTVESLSITENGTYTAPSGKAYSPVSVNVPLPSNAYLLQSIEHEQVATFSDGTDNYVKSLEVAIEPVQSGSGEPSPTNIRPISGWDEVNTTVEGGQNLYNDGIVWKNNYYINASGTETQSNNYKYTQTFIEVEPSTTYSIQADITAETDLAITVPYYTEAQSFISRDLVASVNVGTHTYKADFTTPSNCKYIRVSVPTNTSNIIIYKKNTYTLSLGSTRYGGKLDVINGILTPAPYYASYNGEALTGEWISDRDKYEVGATPTIGAQVVNIGASDTPVSIAPTIIKSLQGANNFFASTGEIELLQYWGEVM